ncbi:MAG: hypothetical protein AAF363_01610 [Bacteroidota bacterium]
MSGRLLFFLLILYGVFSCKPQNPNKQLNRISEYYDISGLLEENINELASQEAGISKEVSYDGEKETISSSLDSAEWAEELEYFFSMELNKPQFVGTLDIDTSQNAGSMTITYTNEQKKEELKFVELAFKDGEISSIKGKIKSNSFLYKIERNMMLDFNSNKLLKEYHVQGTRKLIFGDPKDFSVKGKVQSVLEK